MLGGSVGRCGGGLEFSINACWANAWLSGVMAASLGHPARMAGNGFCRRSRPPASAAKRSRGIAGTVHSGTITPVWLLLSELFTQP